MRRSLRAVPIALLALVSLGTAAACLFAYARRQRPFTANLRVVPRPVELESGDISTANESYFIDVRDGRIAFGHVEMNATWIPPIVDGKPFRVEWDPVVSFPVVVPAWLLGAVAAITGTPVVVTARRSLAKRNRVAARLCVACGYDLRATPERCPECGAVPVTAPDTL